MTPAKKTESWDDFWAEVSGGRTETIRGVKVQVPTDLPLGYQERAKGLSHLGEDSQVEDFEPLVTPLFGEGVFPQWVDAGMGAVELLTAITWGMLQARGRDVSFRDAYEIVTSDDPGKAMEPNRAARRATAKKAASKPRSSGTGGPSKRTSNASTATGRRTSRA